MWQQNLYILALAQHLTVAGFSLIFPFLPLYVEELGVATFGSVEFWAGMVFSAQALTMAIVSPIWGALADRVGRKMMVERAMFGGAILLVLMGFARSAEELTLLRALQGLVTGVISAANALVAASTPRHRSGWALGLMQTSAWAGGAIGPLFGGLLADSVGFRMTFQLTALISLLSGLSVHFWVTEQRETLAGKGDSSRGSIFQAWKAALAAEGLRALYAVKFAVRLATTILLPIAPLLVATLMPRGDRVATVAGVFTAVSAAASTLSGVWFGSLGDRIGHRPVLIAGCLVSGIGHLLFLGVDSVGQLIALAIVTGIANGAVIPNIGALLANASPQGGQGTVYGIDASVDGGARFIAPLIGTSVAAAFTLQAGFAVAGLVFLLAAGLAVTRLPGPPKPPRRRVYVTH